MDLVFKRWWFAQAVTLDIRFRRGICTYRRFETVDFTESPWGRH
jgi:hypothetical protein